MKVIQIGDVCFEKSSAGADYNLRLSAELTDRKLINATACIESTIVFAAREG